MFVRSGYLSIGEAECHDGELTKQRFWGVLEANRAGSYIMYDTRMPKPLLSMFVHVILFMLVVQCVLMNVNTSFAYAL